MHPPADLTPIQEIQNRTYTYSPAGDITVIDDLAWVETYYYSYDKLHRLTSEVTSTGSVGVIPGILELNYDNADHIHAVSSVIRNGVTHPYTYDANGNQQSGPDMTDPLAAVTRTLTFNADNMPTKIVHPSGGTINLTYDGDSVRAKKSCPNGTTYYLSDTFELINNVETCYIFAGNLRVAMVRDHQTTTYFHKDHLGSSTAMTDAGGNTLEVTRYMPFGGKRGEGSGITSTAYGFTDQELDKESGLYNYDARLYDPVAGRFASADTIVPKWYDTQSFDRYAYCRNDPLKRTDPSGHRIQVGAHTVAGALQHTSTIVTLDTPELQSAFGSHPDFQNTNAQGQQYGTFGAGPVDGRLQSDRNRPKDLDLTNKNTVVDVDLNGQNEVDVVNGLLESDDNYGDDLTYGLFPGGPSSTNSKYNSNSYTSGLLNANNLNAPVLPITTTPGYSKPVPASEFSGPVGIDGSNSPPGCIKKIEKTSKTVLCFSSATNPGLVFGINQRFIPGFVRCFSIFFTLRESRRTPDPVLPRDRSRTLQLYPWRLGSEAHRLLQRWGSGGGFDGRPDLGL